MQLPTSPIRSLHRSTTAALGALLALSAACTPPRPAETFSLAAPAAPRRAILVSFDALNEARVVGTMSREVVPTFHALFAEGACASSARPAFPSVTAASHASLWTGAYGDVNGIPANSVSRLPRSTHTVLDMESGFFVSQLRAEPLWITAGRAGLTVVAQHPTQAPGVPGIPPVDLPGDTTGTGKRAEMAAVLKRPGMSILNGYVRRVTQHQVVTERSAPSRAPGRWAGLERLAAGGVPPREIAWAMGRDSVFALLHGARSYTHVLIAPVRDVARGVDVAAAPVERSPVEGRPLARHFSAPIRLPDEADPLYVSVRVFELTPDGSRYLIFVPEVRPVDVNHPELAEEYQRVVGGWVGNGAWGLVSSGAFGTPLSKGGDGTAEERFLESLELLTRQFMRGAEWAWRTKRPALFVDYFPLADDVDHQLWGLLDPAAPGYDAAVAARVARVRERAWALNDLRLAQLRRFVRETPNAALIVSGDHGMRSTWRTFYPNVALARAGLLAVDSAGRIDLSRTRALAPNGYYVMINRRAWKGGIVSPEEEQSVLAAAERALREARGRDGAPIVTRIWRAADTDTLGLGGPAGGDLYYDVARGYFWSSRADRPAVEEAAAPKGEHGFPSPSPEMHTVLCADGPAFAPRRIGEARTIDVAPTVSEWLGIPAPADARGTSRLEALRKAAMHSGGR